MEVLDDQGRLFGAVNVVDALVVVSVLVAVAAGVAFVDPFSQDRTTVRYVTVDLGDQPPAVAAEITPGDAVSIDGPQSLTVTDTFVTPGRGDNVSVLVRSRVRGSATRGSDPVEFRGRPLRRGRTVAVETTRYDVTGRVTSVDADDPTLAVRNVSVTANATVSPSVATSVERGDTFQLAGRTVAVVRTARAVPAASTGRRSLVVGIELRTVRRGDGQSFAGSPVTLGTSIPFRSDRYEVTTTITEIGTTDVPTRQVPVVVETVVSASTARSVSVGDRYRIGNQSVGVVRSVDRYPTTTLDRQRLVVELSLTATQGDGTVEFAGRPVSVGAELSFRTDEYVLSGTIVRRGARNATGERTQTTAVVRVENVSTEVAAAITTGPVESIGDQPTAVDVVDRRVEPATVVLRSDDGQIYAREHPRRKDVTLTAELSVRPVGTALLFRGRPLQVRSEVVLPFESVLVTGTVVALDPAEQTRRPRTTGGRRVP